MPSLIERMRSFQWTQNRMLAALAALYLLTHLPLLNFVPLMRDEGLYAIMIEEQLAHPTLVPTFLGYEVPWKPGGFFWIYATFVKFLAGIQFLPLESVYRLPGTLFGLANILLVFFILKKLMDSEYDAFLASLLYSSIFLITNIDSRVLTDTLCGTAVLAGILAYMEAAKDRNWHVVGGALTFVAYFIKQVNAAAIPFVGAAYLFQTDRRKLTDPVFLASLLAFPLAMLLFDISISPVKSSLSMDEYLIQNVFIGNISVKGIGASMYTFFLLASVWITMSAFGFWKNWRRNTTLSAWYLLIIFPLIGGTLMPWYFYPVMVPIAYFSYQFLARDTDGTMKKDAFFYGVFAMLAIAGFGLGLLVQNQYRESVAWEKDAGEFLAGKENVMIIGDYAPSIPAYKMLEEKRASGRWLDVGWITLKNETAEDFQPFLKDYHADVPDVVDGSFADFFWRTAIYRKDTNITRFDYICIVGNETVNPGGELVLNASPAYVYRMIGG